MTRSRFPLAEISPDAVLGASVSIEGDSVVIGPTVRAQHTIFADHARVFGGTFNGSAGRPSRVAGETVVANDPLVISSVLCCDSVRDSPVLLRCGVFEQAQVYGQARLSDVTVDGHARVYGDAVLDGSGGVFCVGGRARVCAGVWTRPPRVASVGWVESLRRELCLTEGPAGWAMVGCTLESYDRWFAAGWRWGRMHYGLSVEQVRIIWQTFERWSSQARGPSPTW